jgi:YebC/PmpR family DNA-binding regulatory protein
MAGHSQFKNIMYRKGAQDKKRAKIFSKLSREISIAAKQNGDNPDMNPRLRLAIRAAKNHSMPKTNIEKALKHASKDDLSNYESLRYEGYGPGGVAIVIDTLTDNKNRTASNVRSTFSKNGGNLGETGSVAFLFDHLGCITYNTQAVDVDTLINDSIESGALDFEILTDLCNIYCPSESLHEITKFLEEKFDEASEVQLVWKPKNIIPVENKDIAKNLLKLLDSLENDADTQSITANFDIDESIMEELESDS